jgi:hypothetical protein
LDAPRPRDFSARINRTERARAVLDTHRQRLRKRYAALLAILAIPAMASAAEWPGASTARHEADVPHRIVLQTASYAPLGYDPQIHSDAADSTVAADALGGPVAQSFISNGSEIDRVRAEQCLTMAVYYEAATESDDGQRAVAQVVLNRVAHPAYPNTVCGVVFQGSERSTGCQFTFTCDGSLAKRPMAYWWNRANRVAREALAGFVYAPVGLATNYHATYVHPNWSDILLPVTTIGAHRFYRLPGAGGMSRTFRVTYVGGEPIAAPHPHTIAPALDSGPDPVAIAHAYEASASTQVSLQASKPVLQQATRPAPIYAAEIQQRGGDALFRASNLPERSGLSPELERSGQWLQRP